MKSIPANMMWIIVISVLMDTGLHLISDMNMQICEAFFISCLAANLLLSLKITFTAMKSVVDLVKDFR